MAEKIGDAALTPTPSTSRSKQKGVSSAFAALIAAQTEAKSTHATAGAHPVNRTPTRTAEAEGHSPKGGSRAAGADTLVATRPKRHDLPDISACATAPASLVAATPAIRAAAPATPGTAATPASPRAAAVAAVNAATLAVSAIPATLGARVVPATSATPGKQSVTETPVTDVPSAATTKRSPRPSPSSASAADQTIPATPDRAARPAADVKPALPTSFAAQQAASLTADLPAAGRQPQRAATAQPAAASHSAASPVAFADFSMLASKAASQMTFTAPAAVPAASVLQQATVVIDRAAKAGESRVQMTLNPQELGQIDVQLQSSADGVRITVVADGAEAGRILAEQVHQLERALEQSGVTVADVDVRTSDDRHSHRRNGQGETPELSDRSRTISLIDSDLPQPAPLNMWRTGGLTIDALA